MSLISSQMFEDALRVNGSSEFSKYRNFISACRDASINSVGECAMFLATLIHESDGLSKTVESDPQSLRESQRLYGRYIGRGYIQLSGRENYSAASRDIGYDYLNDPEIVEHEIHAWKVSSWYWETNCRQHVRNGFRSVTLNGIRPYLSHSERRERIYKNVCNKLNTTILL